MEQRQDFCSFRPLFQKCPFQSAAGTFFFNVVEHPRLLVEVEKELGKLPVSFKICSNHFTPGSIGANKRLTSNAKVDWSTYSSPIGSSNAIVKKEKDSICGFSDLLTGLADPSTCLAWKNSWDVYERPDGICFYRFLHNEDFSDVVVSYKIIIQKNFDVLLFNGESLADFQELQWALDNSKLETWSQLWKILDYYASEPVIIKKSNSHRLIQKALDMLNKIEDSSEIMEIIEPIKQLLLNALFKASEVVEVINLLEPKTEIVPEVTMEVESDNDTMDDEWKLDEMMTKQEKEAVQSMLLDSIDEPGTSRSRSRSFRMRRESSKSSPTRRRRSSQRRSKSSDEPESFLCDKCEKFFDSRSKLWMHLYRVHDMTYFCDICGRKFSCKGSIRNHVETHLCPEERRQVNCPHCELKMIRGSLRRHIRTAHQGWKARPCKYCGKTFTTTATLLQHENAHIKCQDLGELKFTCHKCSRTFNKGRNFFEQHLSECSTGAIPKRRGNNLYPCSVCGSRFQSKVVCSKHMAMKHNYHIKDPKTYCFTCKKDVDDPFNHAKLHNCQFICPLCGKRFRYQIMLDKHVDEKHNDANRPWKCEACSLSFRTNNHLQSHIANMHMPEEDKRYSCDVCDKRFGLKSFLNYHLKHFHASAEIYPCTYCGKNFKYLHIMKRHCLNVHHDDPYPCRDCPLKFKVQNDLETHREKHHGAVMALQKYRDT